MGQEEIEAVAGFTEGAMASAVALLLNSVFPLDVDDVKSWYPRAHHRPAGRGLRLIASARGPEKRRRKARSLRSRAPSLLPTAEFYSQQSHRRFRSEEE
jgi:hypothetical protein